LNKDRVWEKDGGTLAGLRLRKSAWHFQSFTQEDAPMPTTVEKNLPQDWKALILKTVSAEFPSKKPRSFYPQRLGIDGRNASVIQAKS
jgi:hypothetical protein